MSHQAVLSKWFERIYASGMSRREGQRQMSEYIADCLSNEVVASVEGGTGIGKSYSSVLAALAVRRAIMDADDEAKVPPIVYATGTVALQEQVAYKDLPNLNRLLNEGFAFGVAKGRGRYYCPHRAASLLGDNKTMSLFGDDSATPPDGDGGTAAERTISASRLDRIFRAQEWDGDFDTLDEAVPADVVSAVTTTSNACMKRKCSSYKACPFYNARRALRSYDVIVANHDLLLCDVALGGGKLLPCKPADTFYLIDEAHQFPDKAVNQLGAEFSPTGTESRLENLGKSINKHLSSVISLPNSVESGLRDAGTALKQLKKGLDELKTSLGANSAMFTDGVWLFEGGCPVSLEESMRRTSQYATELSTALEKVCEASKDRTELERLYVDMAFFQSSIVAVEDTTAMILDKDKDGCPPVARWVQTSNDSIHICAYPTFSSYALANRFWSKVKGAVCFSATLRSLGSFNRFLRDSGISLSKRGAEPLLVQSVFDYSKSGLYLLQDGPAPNNRDEKVVKEYRELVSNAIIRAGKSDKGGVLVIFTSKTAMSESFELIKKKDSAVADMILKQGDMSRDSLLKCHRKAVEAGRTSIIFGLASFREGVDLPGRLCSVVIIPRLPFAVPNTPMEKARVKWIVDQGGNSFWDYSLPSSSIWLTQMVGRLIRTESDAGIVLILDNRLVKSRYGSSLIGNLPPFPLRRLNAGTFFALEE